MSIDLALSPFLNQNKSYVAPVTPVYDDFLNGVLKGPTHLKFFLHTSRMIS